MNFKVKDHYYKKAKDQNYLARSIFKLEEIDKKYHVINKKNSVLDLGYSPGSWIQYTSQKVGSEGVCVGIDIKEVSTKLLHVKNITLFEKSVMDVEALEDLGVSKKFDVVVSDMAPSTTGIKSVDQARSVELVETVFYLLPKFLIEGGHLVVKVFDSNDAQVFLKSCRKQFEEFHYLKPKSTRSTSKEFFVIGKGYRA